MMSSLLINKRSAAVNGLKKENSLKFLSVVFPWLSLFVMYYIGPLSIANWVCFLCIFCCIIQNKGLIRIKNRDYLYFFLAISTIHFLSLFTHAENKSFLTNYLFCTLLTSLCILLFPEHIDFILMYKSYKIAGAVAVISILFQSIQVYVLKQYVIPILFFPRLVAEPNIALHALKRPMGLFSEPQAFVSFILPLLILLINKKEWKYIIIIVFSIMLSTSTSGIILSAVIAFSWIMLSKEKVKYKTVAVILFAVFIILFLTTDVFSFAYQKLLDVDISDNMRITNGLKMFATLPDMDMLLGIGGGNIAYYFYESSFESIYASSFAKNLIEFGIVGGFVTLAFLVTQFRKKSILFKIFLIYFIAASFSQTIYFNNWHILTFVVMYSAYENEKKEES